MWFFLLLFLTVTWSRFIKTFSPIWILNLILSLCRRRRDFNFKLLTIFFLVCSHFHLTIFNFFFTLHVHPTISIVDSWRYFLSFDDGESQYDLRISQNIRSRCSARCCSSWLHVTLISPFTQFSSNSSASFVRSSSSISFTFPGFTVCIFSFSYYLMSSHTELLSILIIAFCSRTKHYFLTLSWLFCCARILLLLLRIFCCGEKRRRKRNSLVSSNWRNCEPWQTEKKLYFFSTHKYTKEERKVDREKSSLLSFFLFHSFTHSTTRVWATQSYNN